MGSGDWLKTIISLKKVKNGKSKKLKEPPTPDSNASITTEAYPQEEVTNIANGVYNGNSQVLDIPVEEIAATRIQTAMRAFMARKAFRHMKGIARLQALTQGDYVKKQASNTLSHLHSWSRIQTQIRNRRIHMVTEGGIRQKKLENQMKLEAKFRNLEVEWNGGSETMEAVLTKIQQREEAALKRERAMAYAFSHQWRANSNSNSNLVPNNCDLATADWGWSWMERWIAARPWEIRVLTESSPKKPESNRPRKSGKNVKSPKMRKSSSLNSSPNGKGTDSRGRRLSYGYGTTTLSTTAQQGNTKPKDANTKNEQLHDN